MWQRVGSSVPETEPLALEERLRRIAGRDLRNPLRLVLMARKLARRHLGVGAKIDLTRYLENIGESAAQKRRIIDTFLEIRAPTADGNPAGSSGRVDLNRLCAAVVRQRAHVDDRKQITLVTETRRGPAARALRCGAGVSGVHEFHEQRPQVHAARWKGAIATSFAGGRGRVEVRDPGPGCGGARTGDALHGKRLTEAQPTDGEGSNGLGLAIGKHLVKSQVGTVGAEFREAGGSIFWLERQWR